MKGDKKLALSPAYSLKNEEPRENPKQIRETKCDLHSQVEEYSENYDIGL
jgi:hypothetical protein